MKEQQPNGKVIVVDHIDEDYYEDYIGKTVKVTGDVVKEITYKKEKSKK